MMKYVSRLLLLIVVFQHGLVFAYDEEYVHPAINENAALQSKLEIVLDNLGFTEGLDKNFSGLGERISVKEWFKKGGTDEDDDPRYVEHFHIPLQPWENAGLWDSTLQVFKNSCLIWAQRADNNYSWQEAREQYYLALTTGSEAHYADSFKTLGQIMHLVSDMAVPAHTRNDAHPLNPNEPPWNIIPDWLWPSSVLTDPYEEWVKENSSDPTKITYAGAPVDLAIFNNYAYTASAPIPISALWDQNRYQGPSPDPNVTKDVDPIFHNIGLAEYTNANFFSFDTVFRNYPHPSVDDTDMLQIDWLRPILVEAEDGKLDSRLYAHGWVGGTVDIRLASVSYISYNCLQGGYTQFSAPILDEEVHKDYASMLIPRAVGYSTALLDYFFRGDIDMVPDSSGSGYIITNNSDEEMSGTFALYYDDVNGDRHPVAGAEWDLTIGPKTDDIPGESPPISFAPPSSPAPEHPGKYMLVFDGWMGNEEGAVAGKEIAPPVPYLLVTMSTMTHGDLGLAPEQLPDIVVVWDMATNDFARILDTDGKFLSFPMEYDEFISTDFYAGTIQFMNVKPLLADYSMFTDDLPDCHIITTSGRSGTCPDECKNLSSCSYSDFYDNTVTDSCSDSSNLPGGINTKSAAWTILGSVMFEHPYLEYYYDSEFTYEIITYSHSSTYNETVDIQVAGDDISPWNYYGRRSPILFLLHPHRIEILNNSNAESKYINTQILWSQNTQTSTDGVKEWQDSYTCSRKWADMVQLNSFNIKMQNSFFDWAIDLSWSITSETMGTTLEFWDELCEAAGLWNVPSGSLSSQSAVKNYINADTAIAGLQSQENEYYQYQVGLFYFNNRKLTNVFNQISSYDGVNETYEMTDETTDSPIQTIVRAFCSLLSPEEGTALTVDPWTLPENETFQNAITQMVEYFANQYGVDPKTVNPEYFDDDRYHEQNIWDRDFRLRPFYINNPAI
jgi:hypothetical protein